MFLPTHSNQTIGSGPFRRNVLVHMTIAKASWAGWLLNNRNLFLIELKTGMFKSKVVAHSVSGECALPKLQMAFSLCLHVVGGVQFSSALSLSRVQLWAWTAACQASLSITSSQSLLKLVSIESVMPSSHLILCHLFLQPSVFPSIRVFASESVLRIRWPNFWSFSFSINSSSEYSGLVSFRMDWFDVLAVQVTLKSLLQHHSSKRSILWHLAFFMVQLTHTYVTNGKTIARIDGPLSEK